MRLLQFVTSQSVDLLRVLLLMGSVTVYGSPYLGSAGGRGMYNHFDAFMVWDRL